MDEQMQAKVDAGMRRQLERFRLARAEGMPRAGWKVAFNDPAALARMGLDHSQVAWLDGRNVLPSGATFVIPEGVQLRVEAEIAVRVGHDLAASATTAEARAALFSFAPALELVDVGRLVPDIEELLAGGVI